jgi:hypothetical protein
VNSFSSNPNPLFSRVSSLTHLEMIRAIRTRQLGDAVYLHYTDTRVYHNAAFDLSQKNFQSHFSLEYLIQREPSRGSNSRGRKPVSEFLRELTSDYSVRHCGSFWSRRILALPFSARNLSTTSRSELFSPTP